MKKNSPHRSLFNSQFRPAANRKRVLIVNCYLDDSRQSIARTHKVPPAMGPVYLAGAFSCELCEVRLYNEQSSGPLKDEKLLSWPDMLVLTGLTTALDRMKHWTAYAFGDCFNWPFSSTEPDPAQGEPNQEDQQTGQVKDPNLQGRLVNVLETLPAEDTD
jgi:hypothetical protein